MGLDTSHNAWHGAYGSFSQWRNAVAVAAGYTVGPSKNGGETYYLNWSEYSLENLQGQWDEEPIDDVLYLLVHSDCDGYLEPEACGKLANRLTELLPYLSSKDVMSIYEFSPRGLTERFIDGLEDAYIRHERLEFH